MLLYRASEATTFVNTCRRVVTKGRKFLWLSGRNRRNIFERIKEQPMLALMGQPMLAGIDDEGDVDALHDAGDPQRV